jgi:diguanylate cyclase (GGDEF)-like protein
MASTDPLTDLLNRRAFILLAEQAFAGAKMSGEALAIILIDIDHFKNVNDQYGHLVGDHALAQVATRLRDNLRARDRIARYGGEEFIVLLESVSPASAYAMAERLRQAVAESPLPARGLLVPVTISLGVAGTEPGAMAESLDQLIAQADSALFSAKRDGRNTARPFDLTDLNNMAVD